MRTLHLIGRLMLGGFFVYSGINHLKNMKTMAPYAASKGVPKADLAVQATGVMMLAGGAMIALGMKPKIGALVIAAFLAGVSPVMHNFWDVEDPNQKMTEMINFTKNLALLGAALTLTGYQEAMPASVEAALQSPKLRRAMRKIAA